VVTHQLQVERRTAKVRWSQADVLRLYHATNDLCGAAGGVITGRGEVCHLRLTCSLSEFCSVGQTYFVSLGARGELSNSL